MHDREIGYGPVENVMQTASFYPSRGIISLHGLGMLGLGGLRLQYTLWGPGLFLMRDYGTAQAHAQNYNVPRCKNQETAVDQTLETQYHCTSIKKSMIRIVYMGKNLEFVLLP